jgi:hypothetical protein
MHTKQATPPTSNAAFHTSASNPVAAEPWKITVLVRVLEEQVAALDCADQEGHVPMSPIRAVWFDVGEVLINETREYGTWADWLGIPPHTFSAMFGAVIARGEDYRQVFQPTASP